MNIRKKVLKQIPVYLFIAIILMESIYTPGNEILAKTNTQFADEEMEYICNEGAAISPGGEFIENPKSNSVMPLSLMPVEYGNKEKEVYNQGNINCCWAFAGVSLFEYKVDKVEGVTNTSFSAEHLVEKTSAVGNCGFTPKVKEGGYASMPIAYFVAGYGPVSAEKYPWNNSKELIEEYDFGTAEYRATNVRVIQNERDKDEKITSNVINIVKEAVYNNGAVYSPIYYNGDYLGNDNVSYYVNDKKFTDNNHAVLIVGWDDNWKASKFSRKPDSNGAWLVRNSWGSGFGDNGYFWVSYEDHTIYPDVTICDYEKMTADKKVYNLDESGRNSDWKWDEKDIVTQQGFINVFNIENTERIKEVTFFESSLTAKCQVFYVPISSNGIPDVSRKVAISDEVSIPYSGYHTIPVEQNISLASGTKCGIMVYVKNSNNKASIGTEYTIGKAAATLNKGESFFCDSSGNIIDFIDKNKPKYGNFSIKLVTEQYDIPISDCEVAAINNKRYNGNHKKPTPEITYNGIVLTKGKDYTLSYENNVYAGTATVVIKGIGNYTGTRRVNFTILKAKFAEAVISDIGNQCYTGSEIHPTYTVTFNNNKLTLRENVDYAVSYINCTNAGTATLKLTGKGNYSGTKSVNFTIDKANITDCIAECFSNPQPYTGSLIKPKYTMKYLSKPLVEGVDYYVSYSDRFEVGTGMVTFLGTGNFTGIKIVMFEITNDINYSGFENWENPTYTGKPVFPKPIVSMGTRKLIEDVDYTVSVPSNSVDVGEYEMIIKGTGEYAGTMVAKYNILPAAISSVYVYGNPTPYTGSQIIYKPTIKYNDITLKEGVDYTISYSNNINAGKSPMKITGLKNFTGTRTVNFTINPADISKATVSKIDIQGYSGNPETPKPTITFNNMTLKEGTDYTLSYSNNTEVGIATITITGIGNFTGTTTTIFEITNHILYATFWSPKVTYDENKGALVVQDEVITMGSKTLVRNVDYLVEIKPRIIDHCGWYDIYYTGIGKYTGIVISGLNVVSANSTNNALFSNRATNIEFRRVHKPTLEIDGKTLTEGVDYDAYFVGNVYVEMPFDTITELNNFTTVQPDILDIDSDETAEISE